MKSYEAHAVIEASPAAIWKVLVDGAGYTEWDSGVTRLEGAIAPGGRLKVFSEVNPGRGFAVKVTEFAEAETMRWSGGMPLGLFRGVRTFALSPSTGETTKFSVREDYTGPMLALIWRSMPDLGPSFEQFARGLKQRAEQDA